MQQQKQHGLDSYMNLEQRDCVFVENLKVYGYVGHIAEERTLGQKYTISYILYGQLGQSGETDNLNDTLDYTSLNNIIQDLANQKLNLIETLADQIAEKAFSVYNNNNKDKRLLDAIRITVKKEAPPIKEQVDSVGISLFRTYQDYQHSEHETRDNKD